MIIYENYAEKLLYLHDKYYELTTWKFAAGEKFDSLDYQKKRGMNQDQTCFIYRPIRNDKYKRNNVFPATRIYTNSQNDNFFIEHRSYKGLVGDKAVYKVKNQYKDVNQRKYMKNREGKFKLGKHGLFDFYANTGDRYKNLFQGESTHYNLFQDLYKFSSYNSCEKVWMGMEEINSIANSQHEEEALLTLSLLMFEQEINYGEERDFQQSTNFKVSYGFRPRDMLMGFVHMLFHDKALFDRYPFWKCKGGFKIYPDFGNVKKGEGYENLESAYKIYFEHYRNKFQEVKSIMENEQIKSEFIKYANQANQNPDILSLKI